MTKIQDIPIAEIKAGNNDRVHFDHNALVELADSIAAHGLAQPITIRPINGHYEIVAGERRFRAISQILEWETIQCIVKEMTNEEASAIMLAENTGRADLNPIEEAQAYLKRQEEFDWTPEHIAKVAGVSENLVTRRLSLLLLVAKIQHLISFGNMPIGHAETLTKLDNNRQRIALRIFNQSTGITLKSFRHIVNELFEEQSQESLFNLENFWVEQVALDSTLALSGKNAVVNAPTRNDLPEITVTGDSSTSKIMKSFINDLIENGQAEEAAVVGTLYTKLVKTNFCTI